MPTSRLFTPLRVGTFDVANRIMQAAHSKVYSDRFESARETAYFVRRAEGGCALFVAGNHLIHPSGSIRHFQDAFDPRSVDANRRMTDAVHEAGARVLVQLNHHGAQTQPDGPVGPRPAYAPSRVISPSTGHATTAATPEDIAELVESWARSAELARLGGFDGVEVHMATATCCTSSCLLSTTCARTRTAATSRGAPGSRARCSVPSGRGWATTSRSASGSSRTSSTLRGSTAPRAGRSSPGCGQSHAWTSSTSPRRLPQRPLRVPVLGDALRLAPR